MISRRQKSSVLVDYVDVLVKRGKSETVILSGRFNVPGTVKENILNTCQSSYINKVVR